MQLLQWLQGLQGMFPNASINVTLGLLLLIIVFIVLTIIELDKWLDGKPVKKGR